MYYVYVLLDPRKDNIPFYVGKGIGDRWKDHLKESSDSTINERKYNVVQKIIKLGLEVGHEIVKWFEDEEQAYLFEEHLIKKYGRRGYEPNGILTNICLDSRPPRWQEGPNRVEIIEKIKATKAKMDLSHSQEAKDKIGNKLRGKKKPPRTEEHRLALSNALKGKSLSKPCSDETRKKRSENQKGKKASDDTRKSISKALTGRKLSEEHKQKLREARLAAIARNKE